ncbi:nucleoside-diphosphate kinase [Candidatus Parcubacteria bacterium 4484_255]|nr:MAG: nucleoside-diphosphate kinase [Candidatus Parcubacteria bacterium 4484_255]
MEKTLILLKPDALQRNLLGQIIIRFENKGLKIVGLKMMKLSDTLLSEHYAHHKDKPFFRDLVNFMESAPVIAIVLEGLEAVNTVRILCGPTSGRKADVGSIRGDFSMSSQHNIIHASDSVEAAANEIQRFFKEKEIFDYQKIDLDAIYAKEELG